MLLTVVNAQDKLETSKTSCVQQSAYPNKLLSDLKKILIEKAKQESLEELYGTLISTSTDIENGKIMSDKMKSRAVGAVRINGNPSFYNGKNLGEICTDVNVYITKKDLEKYSPKKVSLTHFCFNDSTVAMNNIKQEAKYSAYKEIISQYKPSLKLDGKQSEKFIHGFTISNDKFDFDTASYCFNAVATVLPYELEMDNSKSSKKIWLNEKYGGLKST
jgi:HrpA-like RNA helicase